MRPDLIQDPAAAIKASQEAEILPEIFTVSEISIKWKRSEDVVRRIFANEPGVLRFGHPTLLKGRKYQRRYFSLRIPRDLFLRVRDRLQQPVPTQRPLRPTLRKKPALPQMAKQKRKRRAS